MLPGKDFPFVDAHFCFSCRLVLLHPKSGTDAASGSVVISGTPLELHAAFGTEWSPIHLFNDSEVFFFSLFSGLSDVCMHPRPLLGF